MQLHIYFMESSPLKHPHPFGYIIEAPGQTDQKAVCLPSTPRWALMLMMQRCFSLAHVLLSLP